MKTTLKTVIVLLIITIAFSSSSFAQKKAKPFKGIVTYSLKYSGADITPAQEAQMPKEQIIKIWENKSLQEQTFGPVTVTEVSNGEEMSKTTLYDLSSVNGTKVYVKKTKTEIDAKIAEKKDEMPVIVYFDEYKDIAGFKAQKAEVSFKIPESEEINKVIVYFSEEIGSDVLNYGDSFHGLKGFPLEFELLIGKIKLSATVSSIVKGKVKEIDFLIPTDYKQITQEELDELSGGGGGEEE